VPSRAIVLTWKDVVMGIVDCVEVVWNVFGWYAHWRDCLVVIVNTIDVLARFCRIAEARPLDGRPE
jgi:hypothetical protein